MLIFNASFSMQFERTDVMVQAAGDIGWIICVTRLTTQQADEPQQASSYGAAAMVRHRHDEGAGGAT